MKATLTVPNDFERGVCSKCPLHWKSNGDFYCLILHQLWWFDGIEAEDCPLEIIESNSIKPKKVCRHFNSNKKN